jgi:hypothetical protein
MAYASKIGSSLNERGEGEFCVNKPKVDVSEQGIATHMDERHFSSAIGCFYLGYVITNLISLHLPS